MNPTEQLLARVMNILAETYRDRLVLKGGMLLRLLNSPRATQDLDYAWVRDRKRSVFAKDLKETLKRLEGVVVEDVSVNSRGIFLDIRDVASQRIAKVEINVVEALRLPATPLTSARLTEAYNLPARIILTMNIGEALSHKIAASLERNLLRDLFDLMILEPMGPFDAETLYDRLSRLEANRGKPKKISPTEAASRLTEKLKLLTQKSLDEELAGVLSREQLAGLNQLIRASVSRIIQKIEALDR